MKWLRVEFGRPRYGRIGLKIDTGSSVIALEASNASGDSIGELVTLLASILKGGAGGAVAWHQPAAETELKLTGEKESALLLVSQYADSRRSPANSKELLRVRGSRHDICLSFWRALQRLQSSIAANEYKAVWGHPFPDVAVAEITLLLQQVK